MAKKQYCYTCGKQMLAQLISTTYDNDTGKPYRSYNYQCPDNKGKWFFNKHIEWEPYYDF